MHGPVCVVSVCAGFVTINKESGIICLVYYMAQEYLDPTQKSWFPGAQANITKVCITYLLFDVFAAGFCATDQQLEERLEANVLYNYAA